ncbi:MAG: nitroreductase [Gammaproteobacteria bacterium]|nr:nitroreductase [Gammaproteobacteria bacterium]
MDAITALHTRHSTAAAQLNEPAPSETELASILKAAVTAPDHAGLTPWQFILIRGDARQCLGDLMAETFRRRNPTADSALIERQRKKPLRSPLIITVVATIVSDNPKVPEFEQILSAAAAAEHIQLACHALGYGSIWLSGDNMYDWVFTEALGLNTTDRIVGFLYIGTPNKLGNAAPRPNAADFVREWTAICAPEESAI